MILLDTNVLVWLIMGDTRLKPERRALIEDARVEEGVRVSAITAWEISMLVDKGRLDLRREVSKWIEAVFSAPGVRIASISPAIAVDAGRLPGAIHGDPADRLIIATARELGCPLLTSDKRILAYAAAGHVSVIDARL